MEQLIDIARKFDIKGEVVEVKPLGNGLINDTFRVVTTDGYPDYVLQRINNAIFKDVELLQNNIEAVTRHIRKKLEAAHTDDIDRFNGKAHKKAVGNNFFRPRQLSARRDSSTGK